jgi:hypothetical protein
MAGVDGSGIPSGWYTDPDNEFGVRYWDGTSWTGHRALRVPGMRPPQPGYLRRALLLAALPWLTFEIVLLLVPVWAPDESYHWSGVLGTAVAYAFFVASPGLVVACITTRKVVVAFATVVLVAAAAWAAIAMVSSDDAQAGLAVLIVWYVAVPLIALVGVVELVARSRSRRRS